jgi:hypothetical protein
MHRKRIIIVTAAALTLAGISPALAGTQRIGPVGYITVSSGGYVELDGSDSTPLEAAHPWLDGYVSVGRAEAVGGPGICMGGENDRTYYSQPGNQTSQDCNEQLLDDESIGSIGG